VAPDGRERRQLTADGTTFVPLRYLRRSGMNPLRDLALLGELTAIYRAEGVTHALHFTIKPVIYGSLAARRAGVVNISTLTGLGYTFLSGRFNKLVVRQLYRVALVRADLVLFHNADDRALFLHHRLCRPGNSAVVGGSGLRLSDFPQAPYTAAEPGRCLFAGRLLTDKGIREYVAAARIIRRRSPDHRFYIAGPLDPGNPAGVSAAELDRWVADGDIIYAGETNDIRPHLTAASVVVLPSYREGCPRVLLEAAATGRALVGTDTAGVREVVHPGKNGLLVPVRSTEELAEAITQLLERNNLARLEEYARYGRELVENGFSEEAVNKVYLEAVARLSR